MFIHTVYFWIRPDAPKNAPEQLAQDCRELLSKIPAVEHLWAGKPVVSPRPVVDSSFAVGLTVILTNEAAHEVYQTHPLHLLFIERNKESWSRVQVYDFQ